MVAIEIASRGNTDEEIDRKVDAYLSGGALEVWIVRPKTLSMTVFRPQSALRVTATYDRGIAESPFVVNVPDLLQA